MNSPSPIDSESYQKAHQTYSDLHGLLDSLSVKLSDVSGNVDKEFLSAYRVHMLSIQTEMKDLTDEVNRGVQALNSDGHVAKLEEEVKWFVDESTRLRQHVTSMDKDCQQMLTRLKAMNEQKVYLNDQLKAIMKRNRVLQAEIEYARQFIKPNGDGVDHLADERYGSLENYEAEPSRNQFPPSGSLAQYDWTSEDDGRLIHDMITSSSPKDGLEKFNNDEDLELNSMYAQQKYNNMLEDMQGNSLKGSKLYHEELRRQASGRPPSSANFLPSPRRVGSSGSPSKRNNSSLNVETVALQNDDALSDGMMLSPSNNRNDGGDRSTSRAGSRAGSRGGSLASSNGLISPSSQTKLMQRKLGSWGTAHHHHVNYPHSNVSRTGTDIVADNYRKPGEPPLIPHNNIIVSNVIGARASSPLQPTGPGGVEGFHPVPVYQRSEPKIVPRMQSPIRSGRRQNETDTKIEIGKKKKVRHKSNEKKMRQLELKSFLEAKSPSEIALEEAIATTFLEIRNRKLLAAKRGAVKRYSVSMTGKEEDDLDEHPQNRPIPDLLQPGLVSQGFSFPSFGAGQDDEEDELLRKPLIEQCGGISGMGLKQFSENDRFSCIVKYLLKRDQFQELVWKLQERI